METVNYSNLGDNSHKLAFTVDKVLKDKILNIHTVGNNVTFIDDTIKEVNLVSANMIVDYNYEIISRQHMNIAIVFKHIFKSLAARQTYVKASIIIDEKDHTITLKPDPRLMLNFSVPSKAEHIGLLDMSISVNDNDADDNAIVLLEFTTVNDVSGDKCFDALITLLKECIIDAIATSKNKDM